MKHFISYLTLILSILLGFVQTTTTRAANAMVGTGTPASCDEAAFDTALATVNASGGGTIVFNCGGSPHTIEIYTSATITSWVTIIGQNQITLSAQGVAPNYTRPRFFEVAEGASLWMEDIILTGGRSPSGTGWGAQGGSIVLWDDGVDVDTALVLKGVTITNSASSAWGGAIANEGGMVVLERTSLQGSAKWGGAYNGANGYEQFTQVTISSSSSTSGGGGLRFWNSKQSVIDDSTINYNTTDGMGGGIENIGGNLTIHNSYIEYNSAGLHGAGIKNSYNNDTATHATLSIEKSSISDNTSSGNGGGLDSNDTLIMRNSSLWRNNAVRGGGISNWGGQMTLSAVTLGSNTARNGGGLFQHGGGSNIVASTISENSANEHGGGLYLEDILGANSNNWLSIADSQIIGNSASLNTAGIFASSAYFTITNSTLSQNTGMAIYLWQTAGQVVGSYLQIAQSSLHDNGAGIYQGQGSYLSLTNSTISQNSGWGVFVGIDSTATNLNFSTLRGNTGGQLKRTGGSIEITHSVLDLGGVASANCDFAAGLAAPNITGTYASDSSCANAYVSSSLLLGALALNGGSTLNHLPLAGSDLIGRIAASACLQRDQRNATRHTAAGQLCDVGAVETGGLFPRVWLPVLLR